MSRDTITRFYAAFARLDGEAMQACYATDATFQDEAFTLEGRRQVGGMWRMLCDATRAKGADVWRLG
jgi:ketosteroid isomerase-like protein